MVAVLKSASPDAGIASRYNIYRVIHKALRGFMTDTLLRVGRMDVTDDCERSQVVEQLRGLLAMCHGHLEHENDFIHPAIEAAMPGGAGQTSTDHVGHVAAIRELQQRVDRLASAQPAQREQLAAELYLELGLFVAENFQHMAVEETRNHAILVSHYSDEEVLDLEQRIVGSLSPAELMLDLRWMLSHMNADERAFMLGGMKRGAPPEVFEAVLGLAREVLTQRDFYKLERALA